MKYLFTLTAFVILLARPGLGAVPCGHKSDQVVDACVAQNEYGRSVMKPRKGAYTISDKQGNATERRRVIRSYDSSEQTASAR